MPPKKPKTLNADEKELWRLVTKDVKLLNKNQADDLNLIKTTKQDKPATNRIPSKIIIKPSLKPLNPPAKKADKSSFQTDKRTGEKLKKGKFAIDATLDLHGLSLAKAHSAFQKFVTLNIKKQARVLLVITGKGKEGSGILRKEIHHWIHDDNFSHAILKMTTAAPHDGGSGAYYLLLRRARDL